jgi:hypothetical protein
MNGDKEGVQHGRSESKAPFLGFSPDMPKLESSSEKMGGQLMSLESELSLCVLEGERKEVGKEEEKEEVKGDVKEKGVSGVGVGEEGSQEKKEEGEDDKKKEDEEEEEEKKGEASKTEEVGEEVRMVSVCVCMYVGGRREEEGKRRHEQ